MAAKKHWIQDAVKHPGALTRKAKASGMSLGKFMTKASKHGSKSSLTTKRQVALAKTLRGFNR